MKKKSDESKKSNLNLESGFSCPIPITDYKNVLLSHGGGGKLTHQMIEKMFLPLFQNEFLNQLHDGAIFSVGDVRFAFSTDTYVVKPIFFPGGDIGKLAVNGTVNDLAMCGARPLYLSAAFIIEEGFPMEDLWHIVQSMSNAAKVAGVQLVTGDTKVVDRGKGDKIFINTSGIGIVYPGTNINPKRVQAGDKILLSGPIASHGMTIMSVREGMEFETQIESDTAPLNGLVEAMLKASTDIHVLRDPTRGGIATTLNEIATSANVGILVDEQKILINEDVRWACEILGFDPLYVANEGILIAFVEPSHADIILEAMKKQHAAIKPSIIGQVVNEHCGTVVMKTKIGSNRVVDMISGEQLPRIC
jgi:hydrogenase expression/formation protein HypE